MISTPDSTTPTAQTRLEAGQLDLLIHCLKKRGYEVVGPTLRDQAIVYETIDSAADLPCGWLDEQSPGLYRLKRQGEAYFGFTVGPQSWKKFLLPPKRKLFDAEVGEGRLRIKPNDKPEPRRAFLGVRACELTAIQIQDRVLDGGRDEHYARARRDNFIVVAQCTRAVETCFCVSMNSGPEARSGFDLALTEVLPDDDHTKARVHYFIVQAATAMGQEIVEELGLRAAGPSELGRAAQARKQAAEQQTRALPARPIKEVLQAASESPLWQDIATRCLACANCTMACPTCFCTTVEDVTDLSGEHAERWKRLDSCFNTDFSYIHGGAVRTSIRSKYRQWMTHKLAHWWDQFDSSGCVGCGRCITWCPVGIDITAESARFMAESEKTNPTRAANPPS